MKGRYFNSYIGFPRVDRENVGSKESYEYLNALGNTLSSQLRSKKTMMYVWDEPQREEFPQLIKLLKGVRKHAPLIKNMVTTPYEKELEELVDIYAPVAEEIGGRFPGLDQYKKLQSQGKELWWYVSCMSHGCNALQDSGAPDLMIERPSVYVRSIGWIGALLGTDAFLYYHTNQAYQYYPKRDPWKDVWDFSGNGDGTLTYPGRPGIFHIENHVPIGSLRLKLLRQTSYDAQYVAWMEELANPPAWWKEEKNRLVKGFTSWSRDYWKFKELRNKIALHLSSL